MRMLLAALLFGATLAPAGAQEFPLAPPRAIAVDDGKEAQKSDQGKEAKKGDPDKAALAAAYAENAEPKYSLHLMRTPSRAGGGALELSPPTQSVSSQKRVVIVTVRAKANVGWFVTHDLVNRTTGKPNPPVEWFELPGLPFILVFPNDADDTINVYAYTAVDNQPLLAKAEIKVSKTAPGPGPGPGPEPPEPGPAPPAPVQPLPPGSRLHFTIIHDTEAEKTNPKLADLVTAPALIKGLRDRSHFRWALDRSNAKDNDKIRVDGFETYITKVGRLPMYIVQDEKGLVLDYKPLEGAPEAILAGVDKLAPPR